MAAADRRPPQVTSRLHSLVIVCLSLACALAVLFASWRHTGSLAFPIDDGYIYSNYVLAGAQGQPFTYNPGELSGGITGIGWYLLCILSYWLLAPLHSLLGVLAPIEVQAVGGGLAEQAGHLYLSAYLPGVLFLALTALGVYRLAGLALPPMSDGRMREGLCLLLGMVAAADLGLVWGALSGLEVALSTAVVVWSVVLLLADLRGGSLRWSLLVAALLPWARPDLLAFSAACFLWLLIRAAISPQQERSDALRNAFLYAGASAAGLAAMCAIYWLGWGHPLPGSFYAKVGGLRLGSKMFSAIEELLIAGRSLPLIVGALVIVGGLLGVFAQRERVHAPDTDVPAGSAGIVNRHSIATPSIALLLMMLAGFYFVALLVTLPWFGQEDRYLLPLHPVVIVLLGIFVYYVFGRLLSSRVLRIAPVPVVLLAGPFVALVLANYVWATRTYAVEVRNIRDAHLLPALWIASNTPPDSVIASEPIGAVRLFSGRRTVDLVGLTTPSTLGTYSDWPRAWPALRDAGATHLFFYPDWFDGRQPPAWASEVQRFDIPDNRIAGDDIIAVYRLDWNSFVGASR